MVALGDVAMVVLFGGLGLFVGLGMIRKGFRLRKQRNLVQETPTEDVESASLGQSELKGTARPADRGTIRAPFSDAETLVADWRIEEYRVTQDSDGNESGTWTTKASGVEHVPFLLDDETGELLVRPDDDAVYEIDESEEDRIEIGVDGSPPSRIREFESERGVDSASGNEYHGGHHEGDRRYYQHLLQPDEDTYVFGVIQRREDVHSSTNEENLVVESVEEGDEDLEDMFMIGDKTEEEIIEDREYAMLYFPAGALVSTIGFGILLVGGLELLGVTSFGIF